MKVNDYCLYIYVNIGLLRVDVASEIEKKKLCFKFLFI